MKKPLTLVILLWIVVDIALLASIKGRNYSVQLLVYDPSGTVFETAPDAHGVAHVGGLAIDYSIPREEVPGLPAATAGDRGLDDVRAAIRWVRAHLRAGRHFWAPHWHMSTILRAAEDPTRGFFCGTYSHTLALACISRGYPARVVFLDGHITTEVYLPRLGHWVLADALYDFIASGPDGEPLSLVKTTRALLSGQTVEWRPVVGREEDDDDMDPATRAQVEGILRKGNFTTADGPITFDRLNRAQRLRDLLLGRPRMIQAALLGQPPMDLLERRLRIVLVGWNLALLAMSVALWGQPRPAPAPDPAARRGDEVPHTP